MKSGHITFIPGLELGNLFFQEIIEPIISKDFPGLSYSAALIGEGSEILGYDTVQSTDHCWGPRTILFLSDTDYREIGKNLQKTLIKQLPKEFRGHSTDLNCEVKSTIDIFTIPAFFEKHLGLNPSAALDIYDWLRLPSQRLLEITAGKVFHDDLGLEELRNKFSYYPNDVWRYMLSCQWVKIGQEEAFAGRCNAVGDELGSQVIAARMVRELMKLSFLMEKKYAPYSKWFGTGFQQLQISRTLSPIFRNILTSMSWEEREKWLSQAYEIAATRHNALKITPVLQTKVSKYYNRPYLVIHADQFAEAIRREIQDPRTRSIPTNAGAIDQFADSTDVLSYPRVFRKISICSE